jgi:hypothetical protein
MPLPAQHALRDPIEQRIDREVVAARLDDSQVAIHE